MTVYVIFSLLTPLAILLAYLNHRFIGMPTAVAVMGGSLLLSLLLLSIEALHYYTPNQELKTLLDSINLHDFLINGILPFLLFAGALNIDLKHLEKRKWEVATLALGSTLLSAFLVGLATYYLLNYFSIHFSLIYCFLFGALISPTDPIAVLAVFKNLNISNYLTIKIEAESLFNDGVGIVLFLSLYKAAFSSHSIDSIEVLLLFLHQAIGGILFGAALGWITYLLIKSLNDLQMTILITLASVISGYSFAQYIGLSGPLAMVTSGIFLGQKIKSMPNIKLPSLRLFWGILDELFNALLFLLLGFELLIIELNQMQIIVALCAIVITLLVRYIVVALPMQCFKTMRPPNTYNPCVISIITWGGLRGGLAIALALSLPNDIKRHTLLAMTYGVVLFSIFVQGLTIKPLIRYSTQLKNEPISK